MDSGRGTAVAAMGESTCCWFGTFRRSLAGLAKLPNDNAKIQILQGQAARAVDVAHCSQGESLPLLQHRGDELRTLVPNRGMAI
eukprot:COSAG02_NODE_2337_length_9110_cov_417.266837_10_plen_84_part_00